MRGRCSADQGPRKSRALREALQKQVREGHAGVGPPFSAHRPPLSPSLSRSRGSPEAGHRTRGWLSAAACPGPGATPASCPASAPPRRPALRGPARSRPLTHFGVPLQLQHLGAAEHGRSPHVGGLVPQAAEEGLLQVLLDAGHPAGGRPGVSGPPPRPGWALPPPAPAWPGSPSDPAQPAPSPTLAAPARPGSPPPARPGPTRPT